MNWILSHRAHQATRRIADDHYSRQKPGTPQFVPPGRCLVLRTVGNDAFWVTSWPYPEFVKHAWPGAWICSAFRNVGTVLSSQLIREAVAVTRWTWSDTPDVGMITFVDGQKVRHKRDPGRCFRKAGFVRASPPLTMGGLIAWQMLPEAMPEAEPAIGMQLPLIASEEARGLMKERGH